MNSALERPVAIDGRLKRAFDASLLARRLREACRGDVLFDAASRGRYATDASIYQIEPDRRRRAARRGRRRAPRSPSRASSRCRCCRAARASSQCGQTVGEALVIDHSKSLQPHRRVRRRRDDRHGRARRRARSAERVPAAARRMVPGRRQHVGAGDDRRHGGQQLVRLALDRIRQHGAQRRRHRRDPRRRQRDRVRPAATDDAPRSAAAASSSPRLRRSPRASATRSSAGCPKVLRRVGGYNIDVFAPQSVRPYTADGSVNLAHLLVGSEGTLAWSARTAR